MGNTSWRVNVVPMIAQLEKIIGKSKDKRSSLIYHRLDPSALIVGKVAVKDVIYAGENPSVLLRETVACSEVKEPEAVRIVGMKELLVTIGRLR